MFCRDLDVCLSLVVMMPVGNVSSGTWDSVFRRDLEVYVLGATTFLASCMPSLAFSITIAVVA